jgi:PadR family transcriptional regulator
MDAAQGEAQKRPRRGAGRGYCGGSGLDGDSGVLGGRGAGGGRYRRSVLEAAVLASIAEATTHGYDLVQQITALAADLVCIDAGSMYRLLRELEEQGLVTSSWQTAESGPSKRVYAITAQGVEALELMATALTLRAKATQRLAEHAIRAAETVRARWSEGARP